jgi:carbonic anhydrase
MKRIAVCCGTTLALLVACQPTTPPAAETAAQDTTPPPARPTHWAYTGEEGPQQWASLDPVYATCGNGTAQSPVELTGSAEKPSVQWAIQYGSSPLMIAHNEHMEEIIDNGHTIQISVEEGNTLTVDGQTFVLKQFHFHTPSEHTVNGQHAPMEIHFVHQSADGNLAVVGLMVEESPVDNPHFEPIVAHLPDSMGQSYHHPEVVLALEKKLPTNRQAYHYMGSLTTPPCSEGVHWLVLKDRAPLSARQIAAIHSRIGNNNRPVQALNNRQVTLEGFSQQSSN